MLDKISAIFSRLLKVGDELYGHNIYTPPEMPRPMPELHKVGEWHSKPSGSKAVYADENGNFPQQTTGTAARFEMTFNNDPETQARIKNLENITGMKFGDLFLEEATPMLDWVVNAVVAGYEIGAINTEKGRAIIAFNRKDGSYIEYVSPLLEKLRDENSRPPEPGMAPA